MGVFLVEGESLEEEDIGGEIIQSFI
jgi:hypothetical protein